MADAVKVLIVERNGVDLDNQEEFNLVATAIPFSGVGFVATDVGAAIVEAKNSAVVDDYLTCLEQIQVGETYTIPFRKQMRVFQRHILDGALVVNGRFTIEW